MARRKKHRHEKKGPLDEWQLPEGASQTTQALAAFLRGRGLLRRERPFRPTQSQHKKHLAQAHLTPDRALRLRADFECDQNTPENSTRIGLFRTVLFSLFGLAFTLGILYEEIIWAYVVMLAAVGVAYFGGVQKNKLDESSRLLGLLAKSLNDDEARTATSKEPPAPAILAPPPPPGDPTAPPFTRARRGSSS